MVISVMPLGTFQPQGFDNGLLLFLIIQPQKDASALFTLGEKLGKYLLGAGCTSCKYMINHLESILIK